MDQIKDMKGSTVGDVELVRVRLAASCEERGDGPGDVLRRLAREERRWWCRFKAIGGV